MSKADVTLPAAVSSVPTARHFVESILSGWGFNDLSWPATLIVSELAANAALHARGESFSIRIIGEPDCVRLEVSDSSLRLPQQRTYSTDATTGRGLRLVAGLAQEWGVAPTDAGKTVWVVLRSNEAGSGADDDVDLDALLDAFSDDEPGGTVTDLPNRPSATAGPGLAIAA
jgi:anti-sigma regulatory factor (Ser/Thr protein kinase)